MRDVFLCHASEDKATIVRPLYESLQKEGITCWYDEAEIKWGDNITACINKGLSSSRFVIVVFSRTFLSKKWPETELNATLGSEASTGNVKVLPLIVGSEIDKKEILNQFPLVASKRYLNWDAGLKTIIEALVARFENAKSQSVMESVKPSIRSNYRYLISKFISRNEVGGWIQYTERPVNNDTPIGLFGSVYGTMTLLLHEGIIGYSTAHESLFQQVTHHLLSHQERNGGWRLSTTNEVCLMLSATILNCLQKLQLRLPDCDLGNTIKLVEDYIINAQKSDGGWGIQSHMNSHILPTCLAINALAKVSHEGRNHSVLSRGVDWLLHRWSELDKGWGQNIGSPSSAMHTCLAIKAIESTNDDRYTVAIRNSLSGLEKKVSANNLGYENDRFEWATSGSVKEINYDHFAKPWVIRTLWSNGHRNDGVLQMINQLIESQHPIGYWNSDHKSQAPVWASYASVSALVTVMGDE